jgi:hypothetical protein
LAGESETSLKWSEECASVIVEAVETDRTAALHALMLDPLKAAVFSPEEIRQMSEEM